MKSKLPTLRHLFFVAGLFLAIVAPARAQNTLSLNITNNTGSDNEIWLTFQNTYTQNLTVVPTTSFDVSYWNGSAQVPVTLINRNANATIGAGNTSFISDSIYLGNTSNLSISNFTVGNMSSGVFYVSVGAALNVTTGAPSAQDPFNSNTRFQPLELSYCGTTGAGGGDITQVNGFATSVFLQNYSGTFGNLTPAGNTGYLRNTGAVFQEVYNAVGGNTTAVHLSTSGPDTGQYVFANAPNQFGPNSSGYNTGPYPGFGNYVDAILAANQTTHLTGNIGVANTPPVTDNWQFVYDFNATINATTKGIDMVGNIVATQTQGGNGTQTFNNLVILLAPDSGNNAELSWAIYNQVPTVAGINGSNATGTFFSSGWGNMDGLTIAGATHNMTYRVIGDMTEGMLTGFVLSNVTADFGNGSIALKDAPSNDWWFYQGNFYSALQGGNTSLYSIYSDAVGGGSHYVYTAPYDDRFGTEPGQKYYGHVLIGTDTEWLVTLQPDGNMTPGAVPEPATYGMLFSGAAVLVTVMVRRKRKSRRRPARAAGPPSSD